MMKTLSYFMSINERRMSCLLTNDTEKLPYLRDLYVQGIIHEDKVEYTYTLHVCVTVLLESIDVLSCVR